MLLIQEYRTVMGSEVKVFYTYTGFRRTLVVSSQAYMSIYLSICLPNHLRHVLVIKAHSPQFSAAHAATGHGFRSIISTVVIYPYTGVCRTPVGSSRAYYHTVVQSSLYPHLCLEDPIGVKSSLYVCLSISLSLYLVVRVSFW